MPRRSRSPSTKACIPWRASTRPRSRWRSGSGSRSPRSAWAKRRSSKSSSARRRTAHNQFEDGSGQRGQDPGNDEWPCPPVLAAQLRCPAPHPPLGLGDAAPRIAQEEAREAQPARLLREDDPGHRPAAAEVVADQPHRSPAPAAVHELDGGLAIAAVAATVELLVYDCVLPRSKILRK